MDLPHRVDSHMSLYNTIHGVHPLAGDWLLVLGLKPQAFERFRDAWLQDDGPEGLRIVVLTRCGGENRSDYGGMYMVMRSHPLYIRDADCDHDSTYSILEYKIPEAAEEIIREILSVAETHGVHDRIVDNRTMAERWAEAMATIDSNPGAQRLAQAFQDALEGKPTPEDLGVDIITLNFGGGDDPDPR